MARHLAFRSGNPALNKNTFKGLRAERSSGPIIKDNVMTIEGTVNKTALSLLLLMSSGYYAYSSFMGSFIWVGFGLGLVVFFVNLVYRPVKGSSWETDKTWE